MEVLQIPPEVPKRESTMNQQINQHQPPVMNVTASSGRKSRPASMLHRGAPIIHSQAS